MKTKKQIIELLATLAPNVCLETIWEHDEDARFDFDDPEMKEEDWKPWQTNVRATVIIAGKFVQGDAYMGGTWEKAGDKPEESNPDISGYFPQMAQEALQELALQITKDQEHDMGIKAAIESLF